MLLIAVLGGLGRAPGGLGRSPRLCFERLGARLGCLVRLGRLVRGWRSPGRGLVLAWAGPASCVVGQQLGSYGLRDQMRATAPFGAVQVDHRSGESKGASPK